MRCIASCAARCNYSWTSARSARLRRGCEPRTRAHDVAGDARGEPDESAVELVGAAHPLLPAALAPLAPRAASRLRAAQRARSLGAGDLDPSLLRIKLLCIAAAQDLECGLGVPLQIGGACRILMPEPVGGH